MIIRNRSAELLNLCEKKIGSLWRNCLFAIISEQIGWKTLEVITRSISKEIIEGNLRNLKNFLSRLNFKTNPCTSFGKIKKNVFLRNFQRHSWRNVWRNFWITSKDFFYSIPMYFWKKKSGEITKVISEEFQKKILLNFLVEFLKKFRTNFWSNC